MIFIIVKELVANQKYIITLTSDLGTKDYYAAVLKGNLIQLNPDIQIIDVTHSIRDFNIAEGAFVFKNAYVHFPPNTIHILAVNTEVPDCENYLVFEYNNQYFIGPDNGIFSLVFDEMPKEIYTVSIDWEQNFPLKDVCVRAVKHIVNQHPLAELGNAVAQVQRRITLHPVVAQSMIRGTIVHIDVFENVIINIHRELFEQICDDRPYEIFYKRWDPISKLSHSYKEVGIGEVLAMFNSSNYLEIAVNMGKAATLLGLQIDDSIQIDFLPHS